jgi:thiamine-phosphate pyrophosphorylase
LTCRLYLITPPAFELEAFVPQLEAALEGGDVACVQMRLKGPDDQALLKAAKCLAPICQDREVAFIVNDRPDIAVKSGADGVHVGQKDTTYDEARRIMGANRIIGVTCHNSRHLAMEAAEKGADYVAFGAMFPTATKEVEHQADTGIIEWWSSLFEVPCVAIGGITAGNCGPLVAAGADFIAVSNGVWGHEGGPKAAVEAFNRIFGE